MDRLRFLSAGDILWDGEKVATFHYTPGATFCYRIEWVDGRTNYGCSMAFVEQFVRCEMHRRMENE